MAARKETSTYSPMGNRCTDFEPYYNISSFPGYTGFHCHDFYEFYLFFSGAPYHCIGGQITPLVPYTLVIIPPFHMHGVIGAQAEVPYERAWMYITTAMVQRVSMGMTDLNHYFRECARTGRAYFTIRQQDAQKLRSHVLDIREHLGDQTEIGKWQNSLRVAHFLSDVYELTQISDASYRPVVLNESMQAILNYINEHFREQISVSELSRKFGISASYMAREFTAYTGRSVYDYVLYRRILCAKELICAGKPFTEIAFECGFNDYSCFLRAFQKLTGQSPSAYKKYIRSIQSISELPRF